ncbi:9240_t:CDS:2 [Funneliformis caledonium]|uniref:9240_t:CDS:1 n=1 Tax=Funneliformis caledonium TaxID=1117310 RepID=A0A9N8WQA8_9GLOM|nr:9240_t:CDS:2 [Funneliformis caledonium]
MPKQVYLTLCKKHKLTLEPVLDAFSLNEVEEELDSKEHL